MSENNDYLNHAASINRLKTTAMETWLPGLVSTGFGISLHVHTIGMAYRLHVLKHLQSMILGVEVTSSDLQKRDIYHKKSLSDKSKQIFCYGMTPIYMSCGF